VTAAGRRRSAPRRSTWLRWIGAIIAAAAAGYLVTCAVFPAPILPKAVVVPSLRGVPTDSSLARLARLGLRGRLSDTAPDGFLRAGLVAWQSPAAETKLPIGAVVKLGVSSGPPAVSVPDVTDLDFGLARDVLVASGLRIGTVDTVQLDAAAGTVVNTVPTAGANARSGDSVQVHISSGPPSVLVPDVVGLTVVEARDRILAAGLRVGVLSQQFEGKAGTILAQRPAPGDLVTRASGVDLTISGTIP
jgi:serine/threonine-protein kinase